MKKISYLELYNLEARIATFPTKLKDFNIIAFIELV